ncbi:MAG: hypothetical protein CSA24_02435 [Deltaproteobacteria bacterium]|nr:MAG: hypothetical protein CSA24_02435 [Deltaproteobacteria bacterium]
MKVHELIESLQEMDPDADVYLGVQPNYPFEHRIAGLAQRGEWAEDDEAEEPWTDRDRWGASEGQLPNNDVLILDGGQVRYGAKAAWESVRRG